MTHNYQIAGMTCQSCESKVKSALLSLSEVESVEIDRKSGLATIVMNNHIPLSTLQKSIGEKGDYTIVTFKHSENAQMLGSWISTYKPILLIFLFITLISAIGASRNGTFVATQWMNFFMGGFFISFSFFKFLDLKGFSESYAGYDVLAKRFSFWGYLYPFLELTLGLAYLSNFNPMLTNSATFILMSISLVGVIQSVLNKTQIQCACLGVVFNLPMSTVTITEDVLMISMSGASILMLL